MIDASPTSSRRHGLNPDIVAKYAKEPPRRHAPGEVRSPTSENSLDLVLFAQRHPGRDGGAEEPADRPDRRARDRAVHERPRPAAAALPFKKRALVHFAVDPDLVAMTTRARRARTPFPAVQPGQRRRRGQPADPSGLPDGVPVGARSGSATACSTSSAASCTSRPRRSRSTGRRRRKRDDDLPALPPVGLPCGSWRPTRASEGPGQQLPRPALGRAGKINTIAWLAHRLATLHDANDEQGLRQGRRDHRPARARPAAAGHDLPVRAQHGRRRRGSTRTPPSSPRRSTASRPDHHHDAPEVPVRPRARSASCPSRALRRHRGRGPLLADRRGGAKTEGGPRRRRRRWRRSCRSRGGRRGRRGGRREDVLAQVDGSPRPAAEPVASSPSPPRPRPRRWSCSADQDPDGQARAVPPLLDAPGHRGGLHPRRAAELHDLRDLLQAREGESTTTPRCRSARRRRSSPGSCRCTRTTSPRRPRSSSSTSASRCATRSAAGPRRWWSPRSRLHAVRYKQAFDTYIAEKGYTDIERARRVLRRRSRTRRRPSSSPSRA